MKAIVSVIGKDKKGIIAKVSTDGQLSDPSSGALNAGIFGTMNGGSVSNLLVLDSNIVTSSGAAGGLIGSAANGSVTGCYATGLVSGSVAGAFEGLSQGMSRSDNYYSEIINEKVSGDGKVTYMPPLGTAAGEASGVFALDADPQAYLSFVGNPDDWQTAKPYDGLLLRYYLGDYSLKTVDQLDPAGSTMGQRFVSEHYGDWPAPEIILINTPAGEP